MTTIKTLWFNHGERWEKEDSELLTRFFSVNDLTAPNIVHMARRIGRKPDAMLQRMSSLGIVHTRGDNYVLSRNKKCISSNTLWNLSSMTPEQIEATYPAIDAPSTDVAPPPVERIAPDDRVLYLCHNLKGEMTAASFEWADVAAIGCDTKKVVNMHRDWKDMWAALNPEEQAILRAAIKEGKV